MVLGAGTTVGLLGALGVTRPLQGFLFRIRPLDPTAFLSALTIAAVAALVASLQRAGRAARVDATTSMRADH